MATIRCPACDHWNTLNTHQRRDLGLPGGTDFNHVPQIQIEVTRPGYSGPLPFDLDVAGIITCLYDNHRIPFRLLHGDLATAPRLLEHSADLGSDRFSADLEGLKQDIEEAETCHAAQSYKGAVMLCRRAMQLGIIECGVQDAPLSTMLPKVEEHLTHSTYSQAQAVKDLGDAGAHRREEINEYQSASMIWAAVSVLNELEPHMEKPASR